MYQERHFNKLMLMYCLVGVMLFILAIATISVAAAPELVINKVYITRVRDVGFKVTWTTDLPSNALVRYGTSTPPTNTVTDPINAVTTHEVTLTGLTENTTYYFEVESGGVVDNNGGSYYSVTTGPTLFFPTPGINVWGYLYLADGTTPVPNAIVYMRLIDDNQTPSLDTSQWFSARTSSTGQWFYPLGSDRTTDLTQYFVYTPNADLLQIVWQGGAAGVAGEVGSEYSTVIPDGNTRIDMLLEGEPTAITAQGFSASSQSPAGQWQVGLLSLLLLAVLALLGMQLRLSAREA